MNVQEQVLYHQIHPLKLVTDISMALVALALVWQHHLLAALGVAFIPSLVVSAYLICFANLERYQQSHLGQYVRHYMTRTMEIVRFSGLVIMAYGSWYHALWLLPLGLSIILFAWF